MPGNWSTQHRPNNLQRACVTKSELSLNCSDSWNPLAWECKLKAATSSIGRSDIKVTTTLRSALKMFSLFIRCLTTDRITKIKAFHNSRFLDKWTSSCDKLHNMTRCQRNLLWQGPFTSTCPGYTCCTRKSSEFQPPQIQRGKLNLPVWAWYFTSCTIWPAVNEIFSDRVISPLLRALGYWHLLCEGIKQIPATTDPTGKI